MVYLFLLMAIVVEVFASIQLKRSNGLSKLVPSFLSFVGYGITFYLLSISMIFLPMGVVIATWSGLGIALTVLFAIIVLKEKTNRKVVIGLSLLLIGIGLLNVSDM